MVILKELVEVRGTEVYSYLKELRQVDFIEYRQQGDSKCIILQNLKNILE